jgi:hypothetical protein
MHRRLPGYSLVLALVIPAIAAAAQDNTISTTKPKAGCSNCAQHTYHPYTAEFKTTIVQTLANGATITHESTEKTAMDSVGRSFSSTTQETPEYGREPQVNANVNNPVEGTQSRWNSREKKAIITKLPRAEDRQGCWADDEGVRRIAYGGGSHPAPQPTPFAAQRREDRKIEDLGTTTIEGVEAIGHRTTTTIPPGEVGNDQPLVITDESWWSQGTGFGLLLRSVREDPRTGTTTREVTRLDQGEPDPSLFDPPQGYEVKVVELHQVACGQ